MGKQQYATYSGPVSAQIFPYLQNTSGQQAATQAVLQARSGQTQERRTQLFDTMFSTSKVAAETYKALPRQLQGQGQADVSFRNNFINGVAPQPGSWDWIKTNELKKSGVDANVLRENAQKYEQTDAERRYSELELFGNKKSSALSGIMSFLGPIATVVAPVLAPAIFGAGAGGFLPTTNRFTCNSPWINPTTPRVFTPSPAMSL